MKLLLLKVKNQEFIFNTFYQDEFSNVISKISDNSFLKEVYKIRHRIFYII